MSTNCRRLKYNRDMIKSPNRLGVWQVPPITMGMQLYTTTTDEKKED